MWPVPTSLGTRTSKERIRINRHFRSTNSLPVHLKSPTREFSVNLGFELRTSAPFTRALFFTFVTVCNTTVVSYTEGKIAATSSLRTVVTMFVSGSVASRSELAMRQVITNAFARNGQSSRVRVVDLWRIQPGLLGRALWCVSSDLEKVIMLRVSQRVRFASFGFWCPLEYHASTLYSPPQFVTML